MLALIFFILLLVTIVFLLISFRKYTNLLIKYNALKYKLDTHQVFENNVILHNAVFEGYLHAKENNNISIANKYKDLLDKVKERKADETN